jgi:uncharacterized protein (DUF2336 family)
VLTDLYIQKPAHSPDEERQYAELALGLIEAVDPATRATVAARLSGYAAAPAAVLAKLTGTAPTRAPAPPEAPPAARTAPRDDLIELFFSAGPEERRLILTHLDVVDGTPRRSAPADLLRRLENTALQRNAREFARTLQRALGVSRELAERITADASGEPIVVAARALGMKADAFQRILLFLNPAIGQSIERVYQLAHLFDEVAPAAAARMLTIWRQSAPRSRPRHEPVTFDDERRSARTLTGHERRRIGRGADPQPSRVRSSGR